nr:hypothetical protein [Tanacetum cinerariifolium]
MYKIDLVTLAPKDKNNRETHIYYLKHIMEQAAILGEIVEQSKSPNPLDSASYCAFARTPQQNGVVERRNRTLVEAARIMLIFAQAPLFLWDEAIVPHVTPKTDPLYDDAMEKLPMSSYMIENLIYPTFILGLSPNHILQQPCNLPPIDDWDRLFQPMFDEYLDPPTVDVSPVQVVVAPRVVDLADSRVSTIIDQDAPSTKPKNFKQAMTEPSWINAMQEEIHEFERLQVWELVSCPNKVMLIKLKWLFKVKTDKLARIEAIRIFVANAANKNMTIFQMGVKTAFLNEELKEECSGSNTLDMESKKQLIAGVQISQSYRGIFLNQSKYASKIIKKYGMLTSDSIDTPMVEKSKLDEDLPRKPVDAKLYSGMIGCLMYLTSSRPDLIYVVCLCARYQEKPTKKHLNAVKRIFSYLKGTIKMGLWYLKDTGMSLTAYADADHASLEIRETKAYKIYLGYATRVTPPKKAQKFKKPTSPKLTTVPASPKEPTRKSKRVKRPAKKSINVPTIAVIIRDTTGMSLSKKKEKVIVKKQKGIDLLYEVALTKEAQYEEVQKKILRDFHKTSLSGSGTITKISLSAAKIKPSVTPKGTGAKPGVLDVTKEESTEKSDSGDNNTQSNNNNGSDFKHETDENEIGFEFDQDDNEEDVEDDEEEKDDEFVKTPSNSTSDEDETNVKDKAEGDEDKIIDYTINQFDDDVDVRLNEPVNTNEGLIQKEVIPQSLPSLTPPPQQSTPTPPPTTKATNPLSALLNFTSVFQFNNRVLALEDEVAEHKKDDLINTQVIALVEEQLDSRLRATKNEFMMSNFAPLVIENMVTKSLEHAVLAMESSQPKSTYEAAALLIEFKLKKILIDKIDEIQSYLTATKHKECYDGFFKSYSLNKSLFLTYDKRKTSKDDEPTKGLKAKESKFGSSKHTMSQSKSSRKSVHVREPKFKVVDSEIPQDQQENLGDDDEEPKIKENPEGSDYLIDLTKPIPLVMNGNRQIVLVNYFFNNDLKYLQGGISTMTYTTSITKTKAAQYDLPGIKDMVLNIWSPIKVAYDKYALWGIFHWRDQRKTFYGYVQCLESSHDVQKHRITYEVKKLLFEYTVGNMLQVLKRVPGNLRRCSAPKKEILAIEKLRAIVELEKNNSTALEEELKEVIVEQDEMKKCMGLMMQEIQHLSKPVPAKLDIHLLYLEYGILNSLESEYGVLDLVPSWSSAKCRHEYAISSLMDTAYRMSELVFLIFLRLSSRMCAF